jgi:TIR domain
MKVSLGIFGEGVFRKVLSLLLSLIAPFLLVEFERLHLMQRDALAVFGALGVALLVGFFSRDIARRIRKLSGTRRVFISYPHATSEIASSIAAELRGRGTKVWLDVDHIRPGDSIQNAIEQALNNSDAVVFVLPHRMTKYSSKELQLARSKGLKIIPVVVNHDATIPAELESVK